SDLAKFLIYAVICLAPGLVCIQSGLARPRGVPPWDEMNMLVHWGAIWALKGICLEFSKKFQRLFLQGRAGQDNRIA
ncbi:MAG: hypothetical protein CMH66_04945, partial [Nioella sp.]|nr:hypothetical protein [Nioella sp.]